MDKLIATVNDIAFITEWFENNKHNLPPYPPRPLSELKVQIRSNDSRHLYSFTIKHIEDLKYRIKTYDAIGKMECNCAVRYHGKDEDKRPIDDTEDIFIAALRILESMGKSPNTTGKLIGQRYDYEFLEENYSTINPSDIIKEKTRVSVTLYYHIACFFVYYKPEIIHTDESAHRGRKTGSQTKSESEITKNKKHSKPQEQIIVFHEYLTAMNRGKVCHKHHNPFNHAFTVRGHWRQYKRDGHRTWVEEFKKGTGEIKDKTYKFAKRKKS
jgi:hypothetical protein